MSIVTVMGPTPPGTGVMWPATFFTSENLNSFVSGAHGVSESSPFTFEIDVADEFGFASLRVDHSRDADVDDAGSLLDHVGLDEVRHARRRHDDVGVQTERLELLRRGEAMAHGDCGVHRARLVAAVRVQQHENRQPDVLRSAHDDRVLAEGLDVRSLDELLHRERRARDERVDVQAQPADVLLVEAVDVLAARHGIANRPLVNVRRKRQLHENAVDVHVAVQLVDDVQELGLCDGGG